MIKSQIPAPLRIAQIAPLYESIPPKLYGGTERIVHYLTEELVAQGHHVTLFASGDSKTQARLVSPVREGLRLMATCKSPLAYHIIQLQQVLQHVSEFDILHFHTDFLHFPFSQSLKVPYITTLHGRLDLPELQGIYTTFPKQKLISISNHQRKPVPQANFVKTIYHGLPENLHHYGEGEGNYFAFLGRISPEKGLENAIAIAKKTQTKLKIAAKVDQEDQEYFNNRIRHLLDDPLIEFIGEIGEKQKTAFLGQAKALLFPIVWPEPFGLVMIEAMSCGTPVIAFNNGSVPEVMEEGVSGFIVNSVEEAVLAIKKLRFLSRRKVRQAFEQRFTAKRMALEHITTYHTAIRKHMRPGMQGKKLKLGQPL